MDGDFSLNANLVDEIGRSNRKWLLAATQTALRGVNPTGIDDVEHPAIPFGFHHQTVAGCARDFIHHRQALASQAVKKRAFPNVGSPNQGNDWFRHPISLWNRGGGLGWNKRSIGCAGLGGRGSNGNGNGYRSRQDRYHLHPVRQDIYLRDELISAHIIIG